MQFACFWFGGFDEIRLMVWSALAMDVLVTGSGIRGCNFRRSRDVPKKSVARRLSRRACECPFDLTLATAAELALWLIIDCFETPFFVIRSPAN